MDGKITTLPVASLQPNPRNPRVHPDEQIAMLAQSLSLFGQVPPILVRKKNKMIIAGHGIWAATRAIGAEDIRVMLWDVDQETADKYMLADNRLAMRSKDDVDAVARLLAEVEESEYGALGFLESEVAELMGSGSEAAVKEFDTSQVHDVFWISIRGPLEKQAFALDRLKKLMSDLPDVEVSLGTTPIW